jgi:hypothetical protein
VGVQVQLVQLSGAIILANVSKSHDLVAQFDEVRSGFIMLEPLQTAASPKSATQGVAKGVAPPPRANVLGAHCCHSKSLW